MVCDFRTKGLTFLTKAAEKARVLRLARKAYVRFALQHDKYMKEDDAKVGAHTSATSVHALCTRRHPLCTRRAWFGNLYARVDDNPCTRIGNLCVHVSNLCARVPSAG